jgi:SAM-dependent methyltransferase
MATPLDNLAERNRLVEEALTNCAKMFPNGKILDVGAGLSPYRDVATKSGLDYFSHDFLEYVPNTLDEPGLQNDSWEYPKHDFACDILEIPEDIKFDIILCTEVFEHVPDPAKAFSKLVNLTSPGGSIIVSVPFLSLMHQAPFYFSSGLSPFWFRYHAEQFEVEVRYLTVYGDYLDVMIQEFKRTSQQLLKFKGSGRLITFLSGRINSSRPKLSTDLLGSAGYGTFFVGIKKS